MQSAFNFDHDIEKDSHGEQQSELSLRSALDNLLEGIQIINFKGKIVYINKTAEKQSNQSAENLLGKNYLEIWPGIEQTQIFNKLRICLEEHAPQLLETEFTFPDGTSGWFEFRFQPVPAGVFIISNDINDKKKAEKTNQFAEERFKKVFEASNVGKSVTKITGEIEVNQAFSNMLGYNMGELKNKNWKDITPQEDIEAINKDLQSLIDGENDSIRFDKRYIHKNGSIIWTDVNVAIHRDVDKTPLYFITTVIDITKQKKTETDLLRSEHLLKLFVEHAPAAIAMFDKNMCYIVASHRYLVDYGIVDQNIIGKSHYEVFPEISDNWKEIHKRCLAGKIESAEADPFPRANGRIDWVHWKIHPWYEIGGAIGGLILFTEVVTQRILAEKALKRSEDLFNKAFHGSPSPMVITRKSDGTFLAVNDSFARSFEYSREEVLGKNAVELNLVTPEERARIQKALQEKNMLQNIELKAKTKSGKEIDALISIEDSELAGEACTITSMSDITDRKLAEIKLKEKSEEIEARNEEYQQLNEELTQINEELKGAKERAEESDRLKTAFIHNISHEIRTPMNSIIGFIGLLKNAELPPEKRFRFFDIVEQSSNQLLSIINDIIDIASLEAGQVNIYLSPVKINTVIKLLFEQFQLPAVKKGISLKYHAPLTDKEATVLTDEFKLTQIISNLLNNAVKFTAEGHINFGYVLKGSELEFYVEDTGVGIPLERQGKIFDRFHQVETARIHQFGGSGLGLSICKGYMELLGGRIWTISEKGKGSVFYFTIPYDLITPVEKVSG